MTNYQQPGFDGVTKAWDIVQREVKITFLLKLPVDFIVPLN